MIQQFINFVGGNLWLIFIVGAGLFNVSIRLAQKFKEQRGLRDEHIQQRVQKQEELRTGRSAPTNQPSAQQQAQLRAQGAADEQALAARKARIEQLRQDRLAQLIQLREQKASVSTQARQSTSRAASPTPPTLSRPTHSRPTPQRSTQAGTRARATQRQAQQTPRMSVPQRAPNQARTVRADEFARLTAQQQPKPQARSQSRRTQAPKPESEASAYSKMPQRSQASISQSRQGIQSARALLTNPGSLRQAMILKEILDVPVALRDDSIMAGSLMDC